MVSGPYHIPPSQTQCEYKFEIRFRSQHLNSMRLSIRCSLSEHRRIAAIMLTSRAFVKIKWGKKQRHSNEIWQIAEERQQNQII